MEPDFISALADVVMAGGITFTAWQVLIAKRQQTSQLEIHVVELHTHFQQVMREIQKTFPPSVNESSWAPQNPQEERALRLYWYLVFDEWYTCKHVSNEKRLNELWKRYRYGVISALRKPAFDAEVKKMFGEETSFFGLGQEFGMEIDILRSKAVELNKAAAVRAVNNTSHG